MNDHEFNKLKDAETEAIRRDTYGFLHDYLPDPTLELAAFMDAALNIKGDQDLANNIRLLADNLITKVLEAVE